jgi:hypothetical protein
MTRRLISHNPDSGISAWHEHDEVTKETRLIHTYGDVSGIIDNNKLNYNHVSGWNADRSMHKVATIPLSIANKWLLEEGIDIFRKEDWPKVKAKLNSNEWLYLRTSPGRL